MLMVAFDKFIVTFIYCLSILICHQIKSAVTRKSKRHFTAQF